MKRERLTQIVLVIVGLSNLAMIYFLYTDLRHSSWLLVQKNETEPMFLSFFIPVGDRTDANPAPVPQQAATVDL